MERSTCIHRDLRQIYIQKQNRVSCLIAQKLTVSQYSFLVFILQQRADSVQFIYFYNFWLVHYFVKLDFEIDFKYISRIMIHLYLLRYLDSMDLE